MCSRQIREMERRRRENKGQIIKEKEMENARNMRKGEEKRRRV